MSKDLVRLYPGDIEQMPWLPAEGEPEGAHEKIVAVDGRGSITRYWRLDPGTVIPAGADDRRVETYVLEGSYEENGDSFRSGSYTLLPPGAARGEISTAEGLLCIQVCDVDHGIDKPAARLTAEELEAMEWAAAASGQTGFVEKILSTDGNGSLTRLLRVGLDGNTTELDDHDHDEEVLIVEGSCLNGEELHPAGTYTFNPPHAVHGPFLIYEPLLCFEVKNMPAPEPPPAA
jgi:hypothetical protein